MSLNISNIYLKAAYDTYLERLEEVREYLNFINILYNNLDNNKIIYNTIESSVSKTYQLSNTLEHTMYSSIYLMLYNLVESSSNSIIYSIHENIDIQRIKPRDLNTKIYKNFLVHFRNYLNETNISELEKNRGISEEEIFIKLLSDFYTKEGFFNGNIDYRSLTKIAREYGFQIKHIENKEFSKEDLLIVKNRRNKLAHGAYSFSECGKSVTFQEGRSVYEVILINGKEDTIQINTINHIFQSVVNVFYCIFSCLDEYLKDKKYLK